MYNPRVISFIILEKNPNIMEQIKNQARRLEEKTLKYGKKQEITQNA